MRRIIGRFYLKIDENSNLIGQFSNNTHLINFTEQAIRITGNGFVGNFQSSWTDDFGSFEATLKIDLKPNSTEIFSLTWISEANSFWGEGIIIDNMLIGDYRNFEQI